jgi:hypothetical protein
MVRAKIIAYAARATRRLKLLGPRYFAMKIISSWRDEPGDAWRARLGDSRSRVASGPIRDTSALPHPDRRCLQEDVSLTIRRIIRLPASVQKVAGPPSSGRPGTGRVVLPRCPQNVVRPLSGGNPPSQVADVLQRTRLPRHTSEVSQKEDNIALVFRNKVLDRNHHYHLFHPNVPELKRASARLESRTETEKHQNPDVPDSPRAGCHHILQRGA